MANVNPRELFKQGIIKEAAKLSLPLAAGGVITGTLLAGGLWPLFGAYAAKELAFPVLSDFLQSLGGNALAGWLQKLGETGIKRYLDGSSAALTEELNQELLSSEKFFEDTQNILDKVNAISLALSSLEGHSKQQLDLMMLLTTDLERLTRTHTILHRRLFEQLRTDFDRVAFDNKNLLQGNTRLQEQVQNLQDKLDTFLESTVSNSTDFTKPIERVVFAETYNEIHNYLPNPDEPIDILEALFPQRGKIV